MRTRSQSYRYPLKLVVGTAVVLFSAAGIAAIVGWRSASAGNPDDIIMLHDSAGPSANVVALTSHAAQRQAQAKARARGRCAECGLIVSMEAINGHDDNLDIDAAGRPSAGDQDESPLNSAKHYELVVRMADGSSRVINQASPANWRPGERVMIIDGTNSSRR